MDQKSEMNEENNQGIYEHIYIFNIDKIIGKNTPYGFELILYFRTIIVPLIKDFRPDIIFFI